MQNADVSDISELSREPRPSCGREAPQCVPMARVGVSFPLAGGTLKGEATGQESKETYPTPPLRRLAGVKEKKKRERQEQKHSHHLWRSGVAVSCRSFEPRAVLNDRRV